MGVFRHLSLALAVLLLGCTEAKSASAVQIQRHDRPGARIEYFAEHPQGNGPWPTVIFLHGHQVATDRIGGQAFEKWGELKRNAEKGYLAVSVSLPGYGGSDGPEDFAGPFTQATVQDVISRLIADHHADPERIVIVGVSLGAVTGALLASHDDRIAGLVLVSGLYDFPAFFAQPKTAGARQVKSVLDYQTGGSREALEARSALRVASDIHAPTLILNGALDDRTDPVQAEQLAAAIAAGGTPARVHIFAGYGHAIPMQARRAEVDAFVGSVLGK